MANELTIVTIVDHDSRKPLKVQGQWWERGVHLLLNDGSSSWTCSYDLNRDVDERLMLELNFTKEKYFQTMKASLGNATPDSKFRYMFANDKLTWCIESASMGPDVAVEYGHLEMAPVTATGQGQLVKSLLDSYSTVLEELSASVARYKRIEQDYLEINTAFKDACRLKNEMETNLYAKFALLLNEKKEYVRRVTGSYPEEDFGPKPGATSSQRRAETRVESMERFASKLRESSHLEDERPAKRVMLEPLAGTSTSDMEL